MTTTASSTTLPTSTVLDDMTRDASRPTTTVLIAVDGSPASIGIVRAAHRIFGDAATYLAINVGAGPYTRVSWAYVSPLGGPREWTPPPWLDTSIDKGSLNGMSAAEDEARSVVDEAGLTQATPLGDIGDPASSIIHAAHERRADVVVVGADARSWFGRLVSGSVEREILRDADFAVLVVGPQPTGQESIVS